MAGRFWTTGNQAMLPTFYDNTTCHQPDMQQCGYAVLSTFTLGPLSPIPHLCSPSIFSSCLNLPIISSFSSCSPSSQLPPSSLAFFTLAASFSIQLLTHLTCPHSPALPTLPMAETAAARLLRVAPLQVITPTLNLTQKSSHLGLGSILWCS